MLNLEEIIFRLKDRTLTIISNETKISYRTLLKVKAGSKNVAYDTVKKLSDYLEEHP